MEFTYPVFWNNTIVMVLSSGPFFFPFLLRLTQQQRCSGVAAALQRCCSGVAAALQQHPVFCSALQKTGYVRVK